MMICWKRLIPRSLRAPLVLSTLALVVLVNICIGAYLLAEVVLLSKHEARPDSLTRLKSNISSHARPFDLSRGLEPAERYHSIMCVRSLKIVVSTTICVYNASSDIYISASILSAGIFEPDVTKVYLYYVYQNPDWLVIDVGANVGQFTLYAAKLGRQVLAVEPFLDSVYRLHKAAFIENLQNRIALLANAVSNRRGTAWLKPSPGNIGGQGLAEEVGFNTSLPLKHRVQTILLDDLVHFLPTPNSYFIGRKYHKAILKIDIEGHELKAFERAEKLFQAIRIQMIVMEWKFMKQLVSSEQKAAVGRMFDLFSKFHLKPFNNHNQELDLRFWKYWPVNVYWKRDDS